MPTVVTYQCPRCRKDIARRFGLITKKMVVCPSCGHNVLIDTNVIQQNWAFNFGWIGTLLIWLFLGAAVLTNQELAAAIGGKSLKSDTVQQRLVIAGISIIPAALVGLLFAGIGMAIGAMVAASDSSNTVQAPSPSGFPEPPAYMPPPEPQGRGCLVRSIFILFWPIFFFLAAVITMSALNGGFSKEISEETRKQINERSAQQNGLWIFGVTILLFILGAFGVLPWTGSKKKKAAPPPEPPRPGPTTWGRY
jgi:DNA-directed RNA polymerase subunit RPC12/RpoP